MVEPPRKRFRPKNKTNPRMGIKIWDVEKEGNGMPSKAKNYRGMQDDINKSVSSRRTKQLDCDPVNPCCNDAVVPILGVNLCSHEELRSCPQENVNSKGFYELDNSMYEVCEELPMETNQFTGYNT